MCTSEREKQIREWRIKNEDWRNTLERRKVIDNKWGLIVSDSFNAIVNYSLVSMRGAFLLNGGGAVALLAFMADSERAKCVDLSEPLLLFVFGAVLSVLIASVSYIGQTLFTLQARANWNLEIEKKEEYKNAERAWGAGGLVCQLVGSLLVLAALVCFWEGCTAAYSLLKGAPTVC